MRRLLAIAFLAALPAAAQIHGVPASVTSITPSRSTPGVPASVTSLGPNGYGSRAGFQFGFGQRHFGYGQRHFGYGHRGYYRPVVPVYVPYYSYPYYAAYSATYAAPTPAAEYEAEDEEPPAPTIYERRSRIAYSTGSSDEDRYGEHYTDYREDQRRRARAEADEARKAEVERRQDQRAQEERLRSEQKPEEPAAVLVFKDGHRQDLSGYAITGDVLYDLGQGRARKIQLADLDLPATIKLNDELGNDFRLPSLPPRQN